MHASEWLAKHGNRTRRISHSRLRMELVRLERECTWCGADTGDADCLWCSGHCKAEFAARNVERAQVWLKGDGVMEGRCAGCHCDLDSTTWEVHHIQAVHLGGGCCTLANLEPLCTRCHAHCTSAQAHSRGLRRA